MPPLPVRRSAIIAMLVMTVMACGGHTPPPCARRCTSGCPDDQTCSAGFCARDGESCEPTFESVSTGNGLACALDELHRMWCWGDNSHFAIENSDVRAIGRTFVVGDDRWDSISVGGGHICALRAGELWCWGRNDRHQVTVEAPANVVRPRRVEVSAAPNWSAVSTGTNNTCAIGNGRLYCWGGNEGGKLGSGSIGDIAAPGEVDSTLRDWISVKTSATHTCAVSRSEGLFCWGDNTHGALGTASLASTLSPQHVDLESVQSLALGDHSTCAVAGGGLFCWGFAGLGQLGDPSMIAPGGGDRLIPTMASQQLGWEQVASAQHYACGRRADEIWCWGTAKAGGVGNGHWDVAPSFQRIATGASSLDVGWNASSDDLALDDGALDLSCAVIDGAVKCWGDNRVAQLGRGAATRLTHPTEILGDRTWTALAAGPAHVCAITDHTTYCWGSTELGQAAGVAAGGSKPCTRDTPCDVGAPVVVTPGGDALAIGRAHTCALRENTVTCWGDNQRGQCGDTPTAGAVLPRNVGGAEWSSLFDVGGDGACATASGETQCWGSALAQHDPAHDPELDGARQVALGTDFGCMLDAAGKLGCFGNAANGAFGNGAAGTCGDGTCNAGETSASCSSDCGGGAITHTSRAYQMIDLGWTARFACGVRADARIECWGDNAFGESGATDASGSVIQPVTTPFTFDALAGCVKVSAGGAHACAICSGALSCWGDGRHGELGGEPIDHVAVPRVVPGSDINPSDPWVDVAAGVGFTCARTQGGHVYCWGTSLHGALGNGATGANLPAPITREY